MGRRRTAGRPAVGSDAAGHRRQDARQFYDHAASGRLTQTFPFRTLSRVDRERNLRRPVCL
ncbi:hypothetical protein BCAR13_1640038 [Paraburkholderia caribensis]|nr:hypothetical protein BCAR13_1640038 [Paraburkholderia caribensis]